MIKRDVIMLNAIHINIYSTIIILFISTAVIANKVEANGAVWNPGTTTGTPGPVKQNTLVLEKEVVEISAGRGHIERIVTAWFRVKNPTNKDIGVQMGFPIDYQEIVRNRDQSQVNGFLNTFMKSVKVEVNGRAIPAAVVKDQGNNYSAVITWQMTFPTGVCTEYSVTYPTRVSEDAADDESGEESSSGGSMSTIKFRYITHTGAYWAAPIGEAEFRYCDNNIEEQIFGEPHVDKSQWMNSGKTRSGYSWDLDIKPKPYEIDAESRCIVWKRINWIPKKPDDDIEIILRQRTWTASYGDTFGNKDSKGYDESFSMWCGIFDGVHSRKQFAELHGVAGKKIGIEFYIDIERKAYYYPKNPPVYKNSDEQLSDEGDLASQPAHLRTDFQLKFLKYLRNYLFAVHGHEFKDKELGKCFQNVVLSKNKSLNSTEKWNVDWLIDYERQIKDLNKSAWDEVNKMSNP